MKFFYTTVGMLSMAVASAQDNDTLDASTLETVTIRAFERQRSLREIPAAVGFIGRQQAARFSPASLVQAVNTLPGVRMEERSPGSYRLNIRGSSLRSPFGVRNVKIYYNGIPFSDPGGQAYLNSLGFYNFRSVEIIKGPGSSVYGAGTGGVLLIESADAGESKGIEAGMTVGNFGLKNFYASAVTGPGESKNKITAQYLQSDGYRLHSALERSVVSWDGRFVPAPGAVLKTTVLYSRLFYQTPGALTLAEFNSNPKAARPAAGVFPSAQQAGASIRQETFLAGLSYEQRFSENWSNVSSAYGMFTQLLNPAIRNYGKNTEPHTGARTSFRFQKPLTNGRLHLAAGAEWQQGFSTVSAYRNRSGQADSLQSEDDIPIRQSFAFTQMGIERSGWELTAGGSVNFYRVKITRRFPAPFPEQRRDFAYEFSPRLSLARKWKKLTAYTSLSRGFSPPTTAELLPSGSVANLSLNSERGVNYDLGFRGQIGRLSFDVNGFFFRLQNTIVQRRDAGGGDFYINSGRTAQKGIETALQHPLLKAGSFLRRSNLWLSHTFHHFRYKEFRQLNSDYAGNRLPGVAPHTVSAGLEATAHNGLSFVAGYFFSDRIPLNDANGEYTAAYQLAHLKFGYERKLAKRWHLRLAAGAENLFDETYSLGNDINAAGGRYYNAAPGRNFYLSLTAGFAGKNAKQ